METGDSAKRLADATLDLVREAPGPAACVVFTNTPQTARETFGRLRKLMPEADAEVLLLTGLTRERESGTRTRAHPRPGPRHGRGPGRCRLAVSAI